MATVFSEKAWDQVENLEITSANSSSSLAGSSSADWRAQVQQAVRKASEQQSSGSASSAGETLNAAHAVLVDNLANKFETITPNEKEAAADAAPIEAAPVEEAAAGAAPEAAPSIEVPQSTTYSGAVDPMPWETERRFQHNLRYLAWMRRADGSPMPVYGADPLNPMDVSEQHPTLQKGDVVVILDASLLKRLQLLRRHVGAVSRV